MAEGTLRRGIRKLTEKIDAGDVFATDLVNDDLARIEELRDDYTELARLKADIARDVKESDDPEERKELRARTRALTRQQRDLDTQMLGLYVEDKDGNRFSEETLARIPVRAQVALFKQATDRIYGDDEGPTSGANAST